MLISQEHENCETHFKKGNEAFLKLESGQRKSNFDTNDNLEMLSWMKLTALDPCVRSSTKIPSKLHKQFHCMRKFMVLANTQVPQRKRKLEMFLKENSSYLRNHVQHKISKMKTMDPLPSFALSNSLVISSAKSHGFFQQILERSHSSISTLTQEDDLDGNPMQSHVDVNKVHVSTEDEHLIIDIGESIYSLKDSLSESIKYLPLFDIDESVHASSSSNPKDQMNDYFEESRRPATLKNFKRDSIRRKVIPVGQHFQADVPKWSGPSNKGIVPYSTNDFESLKWLGIKMSPTKTREEGDLILGRVHFRG